MENAGMEAGSGIRGAGNKNMGTFWKICKKNYEEMDKNLRKNC